MTVTDLSGIDIDLSRGLFIGGAAESAVALVDRIAQDVSLDVVTVDAVGGGRVAASELQAVRLRVADGDTGVLVVVEGIDSLDPQPLHEEAAETREAWRILAELSKRHVPLIITAVEPDIEAPPRDVQLGAYLTFPLRSRHYFPHALGLTLADALDLDDLDADEAYVRVGGGVPVKVVLP